MSTSGDDGLLRLLAEALADTPELPPEDPPEAMVSFAKSVHRLHSFGSELAQIERDTMVEPVPSRSSAEIRTISFVQEERTVILEIRGTAVTGSCKPKPATSIEVETPSVRQSVVVNDRGFFSFEAPTELFRLQMVFADDAVRTDWIRIA